jgi:hypothetical protein
MVIDTLALYIYTALQLLVLPLSLTTVLVERTERSRMVDGQTVLWWLNGVFIVAFRLRFGRHGYSVTAVVRRVACVPPRRPTHHTCPTITQAAVYETFGVHSTCCCPFTRLCHHAHNVVGSALLLYLLFLLLTMDVGVPTVVTVVYRR